MPRPRKQPNYISVKMPEEVLGKWDNGNLKLRRMRIAITDAHINHRGQWIMHLYPILQEQPLEAKNYEDAKKEALELAREILSDELNLITEALSER